MKLKCLFLAGLLLIGLCFRENPSSFTSRVPVEFCLLIQIRRVIFRRSLSILLQLKPIEGVGVWRLWQIKPLHSSSVNDGESEGNPHHTPTSASAPCFYQQDVEHIYFLSLNSNVTEYRTDLLNKKVRFYIIPFQN